MHFTPLEVHARMVRTESTLSRFPRMVLAGPRSSASSARNTADMSAAGRSRLAREITGMDEAPRWLAWVPLLKEYISRTTTLHATRNWTYPKYTDTGGIFDIMAMTVIQTHLSAYSS